MRLSYPFLLRVLPLLPVAGLAIAISAQTGCSSEAVSTPPATADAGGGACRAGETLRQIGTRSLCCTSGSATEATCFEASLPRLNDPCGKAGETTRSAEQVRATLDVCVMEECNGNRNALEYAASSSLTSNALTCASVAGSLVWQSTGAPDTQKVTRTCTEMSRTTCGGGYGYGYTYGYGAKTIPVRKVSLVSSVCTKSGGAESPCDVGTL
jgi:hypothetical protein